MAQRRKQKRGVPIVLFVALAVVAVSALAYLLWPDARPSVSHLRGTQPIRQPAPLVIAQDPLKDAIIAAGAFLLREQLPNGDLAYQVEVISGTRKEYPMPIRQVAAAGSLYTVCRVSGDMKFCTAADRALQHYWKDVVPVPAPYVGECFYSLGGCQPSVSAMAIDAVYRRWQATGSVMLGSENFLDRARALGLFITSFRNTRSEYGHLLYPVGIVREDPVFTTWYNPAESLLALSELYEMTGEALWHEHLLILNTQRTSEPVSADHWYAHTLEVMQRVGVASAADIRHGTSIGTFILDRVQTYLQPSNEVFDIGTKLEALTKLAMVLERRGEDASRIASQLPAFVRALQSRQLPAEQCSWTIDPRHAAYYIGGSYTSCDNSTIRVDAQFHLITAFTTYLEYLALAKT